MKYKISVPGKLFIAGEYAVVEGYHAILLPTKAALHVNIESSNTWSIYSTQWDNPVEYTVDEVASKQSDIWRKTLHTVYSYLKDINTEIKPHRILITSDFDQMNHKLGLGSSGALTIGLIEAVLTFHQVAFTPLESYKLGVLSTLDIMSQSSYADVACSAFKKPIMYKKFIPLYMNTNLKTLMSQTWEGLLIESFDAEIPLIVVHTNQSASSTTLVETLNQSIDDATKSFIFKQIDTCSTQMYQAILEKNYAQLSTWMMQHERYIHQLDSYTNQAIYIPEIKHIFQILKTYHVAFKTSGAGGGDNIIAVIPSVEMYNEMKHQFKSYPVINHMIQGVCYE